MKKVRLVLIWILAFVLTVSIAVYQRLTGPTHPRRGKVEIAGETVKYRLLRSWNSGEGAPVSMVVPEPEMKGALIWKRYKTDDPVRAIPMKREGDRLFTDLPTQPPAGKLEYQVVLETGSGEVRIPPDEPVVLRYKGAVPGWVLIPHVLFMFLAMLFGMRSLLAVIFREPLKKLVQATFILFFIGGLILGPIVQQYAFGALWTGWPFGEDLTDNKTLLSVLFWLVALWFTRGSPDGRRARWWVVAASLVMFAIYLIPHSMRGSELDYSKLPSEKSPPAPADTLEPGAEDTTGMEIGGLHLPEENGLFPGKVFRNASRTKRFPEERYAAHRPEGCAFRPAAKVVGGIYRFRNHRGAAAGTRP